jgi:hypothetical protein
LFSFSFLVLLSFSQTLPCPIYIFLSSLLLFYHPFPLPFSRLLSLHLAHSLSKPFSSSPFPVLFFIFPLEIPRLLSHFLLNI